MSHTLCSGVRAGARRGVWEVGCTCVDPALWLSEIEIIHGTVCIPFSLGAATLYMFLGGLCLHCFPLCLRKMAQFSWSAVTHVVMYLGLVGLGACLEAGEVRDGVWFVSRNQSKGRKRRRAGHTVDHGEQGT